MYPPVVHSARGALSAHVRYHSDDVEGIAERRRVFVTEKLAHLIQVNLAELGEDLHLTDSQRARLVSLLSGAR